MMKLTKPKNLTDKQWAFVLEYPKDWNATQAAIRAGYSKDTAQAIGWENLTKPLIKDALKSVYETMAMSTEEMFARLNHEASHNIEAADRLRALGLIGRGHAAFTDKVQSEASVKIVVDVSDEE